jgi:hypothetical protein
MTRTRLILLTGLLLSPAPSLLAREAACTQYEGALVIADDGKFLGRITSEYSGESIFNKYGMGSRLKGDSIWNSYSQYGSDSSEKSAMNNYATLPPMLINNRQVIGFLTKNKRIAGAVDPYILGVTCYDFRPAR